MNANAYSEDQMIQAGTGELFATSIPDINQHVRKILAEGTQPEARIKNCLIVQNDGTRKTRRKAMVYSGQ